MASRVLATRVSVGLAVGLDCEAHLADLQKACIAEGCQSTTPEVQIAGLAAGLNSRPLSLACKSLASLSTARVQRCRV